MRCSDFCSANIQAVKIAKQGFRNSEGGTVGAGEADHAAPLLGAREASSCTSLRKWSPRTSKFGYWSKEAQAGESSTTGSRAASLPASAAAAVTALSRVPHFLCATVL